ncbi:MAG TPA: CAP domain-containing protein [Solirubrobacteraceae bacterium]
MLAAPAGAAAHTKHVRHAKRHHVARRKAVNPAAKSALPARLAPVSSASTVSPATGVCPGVDLVPNQTNIPQVAQATLCLINQQRAAAGEAPLRSNAALTSAATGHSVEMVALDYFDHVSPSGQAPLDRVSAAGYIPPAAAFDIGENIAVVNDPGTPAAVVAEWMNSPAHRANILDADYRDSGIGVAPAIPGGGVGATYTQDFGEIG